MVRHTTENHDECSIKSGLNFQSVYPWRLWCFVPPDLTPRTPKWYVYPRLRTTGLESDSARNNIHTFTRTINRKQRLQTKHRKNNMSIWPAGLSVKGASKLMSWVSPTSVLFKLFVIMEPLIYFRVCHGTPISKNLKTRITCKKIKYMFIRHFNK